MPTTYTIPSSTSPRTRDVAEAVREQLASANRSVGELTFALGSARVIGAAVGVIMTLQNVTYDAAFDMLVALSQAQNRKVRDLADEIVYYGGAPQGVSAAESRPGARNHRGSRATNARV